MDPHHTRQLSASSVEHVARRVSRQHHRFGIAMLVCAAIGGGLVLLAAVEREAVATLVGVALVLVAAPLYIRRQRLAARKESDRIAEAAANRLDLEWTYRESIIQAHDRKGPHPTLVLDAVPRRSEIDGELPAARIHRS